VSFDPRTWRWGGWLGLLAFVLVLFFLWEPVLGFFEAVIGKLKGAR